MVDVGLFRPRIGFGLGKLHHVISGSLRERIVLGACDAGITHFDLAAAYGDGLCEAETGRILSGRRHQISIATKFGIPGASLGSRSIALYYLNKGLRRRFSRSYGSEYAHRDFSPQAARRGLENSLSRLKTDYVDWFFFHEPRDQADRAMMLQTIETMERLKQEGKIRHYGVSAQTEQFLMTGANQVVGDVVQFELSDASPDLAAGLPRSCLVSAFGLMRFLQAQRQAGRLDYAEVLRWFFETYPTAMPILATNRPEEIARLGRAAAMIAIPPPEAIRSGGRPLQRP